MADFITNQLDEFEKDLMKLAENFEKGKYAKKFLKKEAKSLNKYQKKSFKSKGIGNGGEDSKAIEKSFKPGNPYYYKGKDLSVRSYSSHPLTHLLNDGHRIVTKDGEEKGFVLGWNFIEDAQKNFENEYYDDTQKFIDDMLKNHGM